MPRIFGAIDKDNVGALNFVPLIHINSFTDLIVILTTIVGICEANIGVNSITSKRWVVDIFAQIGIKTIN